jgi:hypothetical protein
MSFDDDTSFFVFTGALAGASPEQRRGVLALDQAIEDQPFSRGGGWRSYIRRVGDRANYPLASGLYAVAYAAVRAVHGQPPPDLVQRYIGLCALLGYWLAFGVALGLVALAIVRAVDPVWWAALLVGIAAIGALDVLGLEKTHAIALRPQDVGVIESAWRYVRLIVDPSDAFSIFGFAPRCQLTLLLVGVASLRWNGERKLGWGLFAIASLYNVYYFALIAPVFLVGDSLAVRSPRIANRLGAEPQRTPGQRMAIDHAVLAAYILCTLPVLIVSAVYFFSHEMSYLVGIFHLRVLAAWQPLIAIGIAYAAIAWLARRTSSVAPGVPRLAVAAALLLVLPMVVRLQGSDSQLRRLVDGIDAREDRLGEGVLSFRMTFGDQAVLFYAHAKSILLGQDYVRRLIPDGLATTTPELGIAGESSRSVAQ